MEMKGLMDQNHARWYLDQTQSFVTHDKVPVWQGFVVRPMFAGIGWISTWLTGKVWPDLLVISTQIILPVFHRTWLFPGMLPEQTIGCNCDTWHWINANGFWSASRFRFVIYLFIFFLIFYFFCKVRCNYVTQQKLQK